MSSGCWVCDNVVLVVLVLVACFDKPFFIHIAPFMLFQIQATIKNFKPKQIYKYEFNY